MTGVCFSVVSCGDGRHENCFHVTWEGSVVAQHLSSNLDIFSTVRNLRDLSCYPEEALLALESELREKLPEEPAAV